MDEPLQVYIDLPKTVAGALQVTSVSSPMSSYMKKGKKLITGDTEVEHHKMWTVRAPIASERYSRPVKKTYYASQELDQFTELMSCYAPNDSASKYVYLELLPGINNQFKCKYKFYTSSSNKWRSYGKYYTFRALTPFLYLFCCHNMITQDQSSFLRNCPESKFVCSTRYRVYYAEKPKGWTASSYTTKSHGILNSSTFDDLDFSWIAEVEQKLVREVSDQYLGKIPVLTKGNLTTSTVVWKISYPDQEPKDISSRPFAPYSPPSSEEFGAVCQRAVDNINYVSINTAAYLKDLKDFGSELEAIKRLVRNPKNPKSWASLFLNSQYGSRLTISDTFELINAMIRTAKQMNRGMRKKKWNTCRARIASTTTYFGTSCTRQINYKVYYKPYDSGIKSYVQKLAQWDLLPTFGNLWDFLPYSFVVDWFIDIGGLLESIDTAVQAETLDVVGVLWSTKDTILKDGYSTETNEVLYQSLTIYKRQWSRTLHPIPLHTGVSDGYLHNIPQLLAIIVQKFK